MRKVFKKKINIGKLGKKKVKLAIGLFFSILFLFSLNSFSTNLPTYIDDKNLKKSGIWATLDIIDIYNVNNSRHPHNSLIQIYGRLYNRIWDDGKQGYTVALIIDDNLYPGINDITDSNGYFQINYNIDIDHFSYDVYNPHIINCSVIDSTPDNVEYRTHLQIFVNISSYFNVQDPQSAFLHGEFFNFDGYLNLQNGMGISYALVNYYWYDDSNIVGSGFFSTTMLGEIPQDSIFIPFVLENDLTLKLNFSNPPFIGYSEAVIFNTKIFSDISCLWNLPSTITENSNLNIAGQLVSTTNPSVLITNRDIDIYYNGSFIGTDRTDNNGDFSYIYSLPAGTGLSSLRIVLVGSGLETTQYIDVKAQQPSGPSTPGETPFFMFLVIFLPILAVIIVGLSIYGYRYYKRQDKLSRVVNLPLESKIINLKILKDSGRLEESLSYLFNAIYMDLVNAKFGRTRDINETIRDFAIISVKDLKLNPTTIYPFIQKIEEIIYAKPFQISDRDFYKTVELFSPIYLQLTGYNFVLNF
ncbi:MAG: hypothetical protein ACFFDX_01270 [Candidatus Odinarchaeota archaeon]